MGFSSINNQSMLRTSYKRPATMLCLLLLLGLQFTSVNHSHEDWHHTTDEPCYTCSALALGDNATTPTHIYIGLANEPQEAHSIDSDIAISNPASLTPPARAPPVNS